MGGVTSTNPATGEVLFRCPETAAEDVDGMVHRAAAAGPGWAATPVDERTRLLSRFADLLDEHAPVVTELLVAEVGKRRVEAAGEVEWGALSARWYARHPPADSRHAGALVRRRPLGVIAVITPWNVPLITPAWKWLPALVAGNTVVWKPSELATATAMEMLGLLREARLPVDVLQVAPGGAATAEALCRHPSVAGVHFTGSTRAGRAISAMVADRFARCALEMGGVNNALVFADADLDAAADDIVASATSINGQKCSAIRRVLVADAVADEVFDRLAARTGRLVVGPPGDPATTLGPLISPAAREHADRVLTAAVARGGRVAGRPRVPSELLTVGTYFAPALIADLPDGDPLETEEVFAPVLVLARFASPDAAWEQAERSGYGLCAAVYSADPAVAAAGADRLRVGVLAVNRRSDAVDLEAPFGGRRDSGNGFPEGGAFVYSAVTDLQAVYARAGTGAEAS